MHLRHTEDENSDVAAEVGPRRTIFNIGRGTFRIEPDVEAAKERSCAIRSEGKLYALVLTVSMYLDFDILDDGLDFFTRRAIARCCIGTSEFGPLSSPSYVFCPGVLRIMFSLHF